MKELKIKAKTLQKVGMASLSTVAMTSVSAFAAKSASEMVNTLLSYIFGIFFWLGILLLAWGVGQLVLAFKNEDADSKSRAMLVIMAAILLTLVGAIVQAVVGDEVSASTNTSF
jgi:hypothetical protein